MHPSWKIAATIANVTLAMVNVALFLVWLSLVKIEADTPQDSRIYNLDSVAFSISVLEAIVAAVAIGLVILGIFGFNDIRSSANLRAEDTARKIADSEVKKAIQQFRDEREFLLKSSQPSADSESAARKDARKESENA